MLKICIVTDSSVSLFPEEAQKLGIEIAPLSIIVNGKESKDLVEITPNEIIEALRRGDTVTTSQPNIGFLDEMMERLKKENYDHILVFSIASYLSGTYNAFRLAAANHDLKNITIVDSKSAAAALRHVAIAAREMADSGSSVEDILAYADRVFKASITYIMPDNLEQLRKGGRVKGAVAALSNLLKIKLCVYIDYNVDTIEKFDTNRVETKLYQSVLDDMRKRGFSGKTHKVYLPECDASVRVEAFKQFVLAQEPETEFEVVDLPAGIAAHVGLNALGVQPVLKA